MIELLKNAPAYRQAGSSFVACALKRFGA